MKELVRYLLFLVVASLVLACGGGGTDVAGGGIGGTGISSGPISGFGSIFVAGTEWETGEAGNEHLWARREMSVYGSRRRTYY